MPTEVLCPVCGKRYNLADSLLGKRVQCKKCGRAFVAEASTRAKRAAPDDEGLLPQVMPYEDDDGIQAIPGLRPGKARRRGEDDVEEEGRRPRAPETGKQARRRDDAGGFPVTPLVIVGGGVGFVLLVGVGLAVWLGAAGAEPDTPAAAAGGDNPADFELQNPHRKAPPLADVEEALKGLRSNAALARKDACLWLADAPPDPARKGEVARALNPLLAAPENEHVRKAAVAACKAWATADNVPGLVAFLDKNRENLHTLEQRAAAMHTLARLKDGRAAEALAREVPDFHAGEQARAALREFGPAAEKAVARLLFHPNDPFGKVADAARDVLRGYGTADETVLDVALEELKGTDDARRAATLEWLAKAAPVPAKMGEVAGPLTVCLQGGSDKVAKAAAGAARAWATADNVEALVGYLNRHGKELGAREPCAAVMQALARLKDERGAEAVAVLLPEFHFGENARAALKEFGPKAEKAVAKFLFHTDVFGKVQATAGELLRGYGTKDEVVLPLALAALKDADKRRRADAADWLEKAPVIPAKRDEVARELLLLLDNSDAEIRTEAARVARVWGTKELVPSLVRQLEDRHLFLKDLRAQAMKALAATRDERGVWPVVVMTAEFHSKDDALAALRAYGPVVEKGVVGRLTDPDPAARAAVDPRRGRDAGHRRGRQGGTGQGEGAADPQSRRRGGEADVGPPRAERGLTDSPAAAAVPADADAEMDRRRGRRVTRLGDHHRHRVDRRRPVDAAREPRRHLHLAHHRVAHPVLLQPNNVVRREVVGRTRRADLGHDDVVADLLPGEGGDVGEPERAARRGGGRLPGLLTLLGTVDGVADEPAGHAADAGADRHPFQRPAHGAPGQGAGDRADAPAAQDAPVGVIHRRAAGGEDGGDEAEGQERMAMTTGRSCCGVK